MGIIQHCTKHSEPFKLLWLQIKKGYIAKKYIKKSFYRKSENWHENQFHSCIRFYIIFYEF